MDMNTRSPVAAIATAVLWCCAGAWPAAATADDDIERGRERYVADCSGCHGKSGHGDGAGAEILAVAPPDLTRLAKDNNGKFPEDYVRQIIDGRDLPSAAHGQSGMPVWGLHYKRNVPGYSEELVLEKIDALVAYLRSIQIE